MTKSIATPPLTPAVLHILLALAQRERHGYDIMKQVKAESQNKVKMGPGTLYGSLGRMLDAGLIRECDPSRDADQDDARRVYYQLTHMGQTVLDAELDRYREVMALAEHKNLTPRSPVHGT